MTTQEQEDWKQEFHEKFTFLKGDFFLDITGDQKRAVYEFIEKLIAKSQQQAREEEIAFILNILDGIDIADEQTQNVGGGTKAIRMAIMARHPELYKALTNKS